jgi:hypothetical protein
MISRDVTTCSPAEIRRYFGEPIDSIFRMRGIMRKKEAPSMLQHLVACLPYCHAASVIRDAVWIGNWIYWTLTLLITNNYDSATELLT